MIALIKRSYYLIILIFLPLLIYFTEEIIHHKRESLFKPERTKIPLSPSVLKLMALNNDLALADLLYIRTLQHAGNYLNIEQTHWLWSYFDTITDLDPAFEYAYIMGGITLSVYCYNGELSNRLLLKGIQIQQNDWRIPFLIGYNYYYELGNFKEGARYLDLASRLPGAPFWLSFLAAKLYSEAGDIDSAIEFLKGMLSITTNKKIKEGLKQKLKVALIEKSIRPVEEAVKRFKERYGRYPRNLDELKDKGLMSSIPRDPFGGYLYIDNDGRVYSSTTKERMRIFMSEEMRWKMEKREK